MKIDSLNKLKVTRRKPRVGADSRERQLDGINPNVLTKKTKFVYRAVNLHTGEVFAITTFYSYIIRSFSHFGNKRFRLCLLSCCPDHCSAVLLIGIREIYLDRGSFGRSTSIVDHLRSRNYPPGNTRFGDNVIVIVIVLAQRSLPASDIARCVSNTIVYKQLAVSCLQ